MALANAVLEGDRPRALEALGAAKRRREEPIAVLASVSRVMSDMLAVAVYAEAGLGAKEIAGKLKMHDTRLSCTCVPRGRIPMRSPHLFAAVSKRTRR